MGRPNRNVKRQARAEAIAEKRVERQRSKQSKRGVNPVNSEVSVILTRSLVGAGRFSLRSVDEDCILRFISARDLLPVDDEEDQKDEENEGENFAEDFDSEEEVHDKSQDNDDDNDDEEDNDDDEEDNDDDNDDEEDNDDDDDDDDDKSQEMNACDKDEENTIVEESDDAENHSYEAEIVGAEDEVEDSLEKTSITDDSRLLAISPPLQPHARRLLLRHLLRNDRRVGRLLKVRIKKGVAGEDMDSFDTYGEKQNVTPLAPLFEIRAAPDFAKLHSHPPSDPRPPLDVQATQNRLPIASQKESLLACIASSRVTIVEGETGSGKSTQLPSFLLAQAARTRQYCNIVVTQPRRLAACSLGDRVAYEYGCPVSHGSDWRHQPAGDVAESDIDLVGYSVRLHRRSSRQTRLLYCTTGVLLRKLTGIDTESRISGLDDDAAAPVDIDEGEMGDAFLRSLTHIIVDEVHERQLETDFLLALLRVRILQQPELSHLKVVLMSATAQTALLADYFRSCTLVDAAHAALGVSVGVSVTRVSGRTHPVTTHDWPEVDVRLGVTSLERRMRKGLTPRQVPEEEEEEERDDVSDSVAPSALHMPKPPAFDADVVAALCHSIVADPSFTCINPIVHDEINTDQHVAVDPVTQAFGQAILVFVSGMDRAEEVRQALLRTTSTVPVVVLHGSQAPEVQRAAFLPAPVGHWRIVLSTNIAETSVTLPDITHVIDCGTVKQISIDHRTGARSLSEQPCSVASMRQRSGRAGRVRAGHCWRLFGPVHGTLLGAQTAAAQQPPKGSIALRPHDIPEIQRVSLDETILQVSLLLSESPDATTGQRRASPGPAWFLQHCLEPPLPAAVEASISRLRRAGAVTGVAGDILTPLGAALARLPMDVRLGKLVLLGGLLGVADEACTIAAALSSKSPYFSVSTSFGGSSSTGADLRARRIQAFMPVHFPSDPLMLLNIFAEYTRLRALDREIRAHASAQSMDIVESADQAWNFCREYGLSRAVLEEIDALRNLYMSSLRSGRWLVAPIAPKELSQKQADAQATVLLLNCIAFGFASQTALLSRLAWKGQQRGKPAPKGRGKGNPGSMVFCDSDAVDLSVHPRTSHAGPAVAQLLQQQGQWTAVTPRALKRVPRTVRYGGAMVTRNMLGQGQSTDGDSHFMYYSRLRSSRTFLADCTFIPLCALLVFGGSSSGDTSMPTTERRQRYGITVGAKGISVLFDGWLRIKTSEVHAVLLKHFAMEVEALINVHVQLVNSTSREGQGGSLNAIEAHATADVEGGAITRVRTAVLELFGTNTERGHV